MLNHKLFEGTTIVSLLPWPKAMLTLITLFLALAVPKLYAQGLPGATPPRVLDPEAPLSVILLGTGIPLPNPARATACTAVIAGDRMFLVDTGRNCIVPFAAAGLGAIEGIFYTHYHSDHFHLSNCQLLSNLKA